MRALVVDDDVKISSFVAKGLREAGFAVDTVANGPDALTVVRTTPFDVAVVDIMLPGFDGLELIEKMRTAGLRLPVVILSARRSIDDRVAGLRRGGRRLPDEAVFVHRTPRESAGRDSAQHRPARNDPTLLRRC
jgi:DNA-binding response OmpR family regulator